MDYNKDKSMFDEATAQKQMAEAFSKPNQKPTPKIDLGEDFVLPTTKKYTKKVPVTFTIRPEIKEGIEVLATQQGFRSSSAFVEEVLAQVLAKKNV